MEANHNNDTGYCFCSFQYGLDKIYLYQVPDENKGYVDGWIFLFNTTPIYWSIAGGSENLATYLAVAYARYLGEVQEDRNCIDWWDQDDIYAEGDDEGYWKLTEDDEIAFNETFENAKRGAGFVEETYKKEWTGRWVRPKKLPKRRKRKLDPTDPCVNCKFCGETLCLSEINCQHD
jgi:hypothetical protein